MLHCSGWRNTLEWLGGVCVQQRGLHEDLTRILKGWKPWKPWREFRWLVSLYCDSACMHYTLCDNSQVSCGDDEIFALSSRGTRSLCSQREILAGSIGKLFRPTESSGWPTWKPKRVSTMQQLSGYRSQWLWILCCGRYVRTRRSISTESFFIIEGEETSPIHQIQPLPCVS